jgi:V8-like Glu-specific endopeptidase
MIEMKHDMRKTITLAFMTVLVLLTVSAAGAYDNDAIDPGGPMILSLRPDPAQRAAESPWTAGKRLAAQPLTVDEVTPERMAALLAESEASSATEKPGFAPGSPPQPGADAEARAAFPEEWQAAVAENASADDEILPLSASPRTINAGTGAYTSFQGNKHAPMWKQHPYQAIGKLYFDTSTGPTYCTAAVIGPDLIVTAARCILDTNTDTVYSNFAFCPAARGSSCPYGTFPWQEIVLFFAYVEASRWDSVINFDVALVYLQPNRANHSVQTYTGWLGHSWNLPSNQHTFAFGYHASKQGSRFSTICAGESFEVGVDVLEMGCDSGSGHLGGPWLVHYAPYVVESANYINGITSYQYTRGRNAMGGMRFSEENIGVLCDAIPEC